MENLTKLITDSGIITHNKTLNILRNNGWSALVSPYYYDSISESVRETDLVAEKQINSANRHDSRLQINIQLFIECKYIKQEILFWFDALDKKKAVESTEKETGLDIVYSEGRYSGDISIEKFSQLQNNKVAKLFTTNTNREDVIYKALNQCLHSQIYYCSRGKKPIANEFIRHSEAISKIIQRPVIVCDNFEKLFRINFDDQGQYKTETIQDHFILETNYREDYFLIDIVDIKCLPQFLEKIETEVRSLMDAYLYKR